MDYPTWKKKPLPQQFNDYNKAYKLNALSNSEDQKQVGFFRAPSNKTYTMQNVEMRSKNQEMICT